MEAVGYTAAVLSAHALDQMRRRGIAEAELRAILGEPDFAITARPGRVVLHGRVVRTGKGVYLLRIFLDVDRVPPVVVTAYLTSKIDKYEAKP